MTYGVIRVKETVELRYISKPISKLSKHHEASQFEKSDK